MYLSYDQLPIKEREENLGLEVSCKSFRLLIVSVCDQECNPIIIFLDHAAKPPTHSRYHRNAFFVSQSEPSSREQRG